MRKDEIRYICISDIHLGNRRNKTSEIVKNLDIWFNNYKTRTDLDILFIAGDIFDRLLDFNSDDAIESSLWLSRVVNWCIRSNIKLRILLGTYSHDMNQTRIINVVTALVKEPVDVKYVTTLSIELMEDLGISVLYIPDEWNSDSSKTLEETKIELAKYHLDKVDLAIMHGAFDYQLPVKTNEMHLSSLYQELVKYYINIGHVHTFSVNGNIIAQGSFDRLTHGEEEPKGGVECVIREDGTKDIFFIENKTAKIFKTITVNTDNVEKEIDKIKKICLNLPLGSYVRLKSKKNNPIFTVLTEIQKLLPDITFSKNTDDDEIKQTTLFKEIATQTYESITITRENIVKLVEEKLQSSNVDPSVYNSAIKLLSEVV